jgi:glycosyltransferase involved in cell wall biosynthesis
MADKALNIAIFICGLGNDGVSHEAFKKKLIFENMGHNVLIITGYKGTAFPDKDIIEIPSMSFTSPSHMGLESACFPYMHSKRHEEFADSGKLSKMFRGKIEDKGIALPSADFVLGHIIAEAAVPLKKEIRNVLTEYEVDLVVAENIFAIPMQIPLAVALGDVIKEDKVPTLAIHHDFFWERDRFRKNMITQILGEYFPPLAPSIRHIVINSLARQSLRTPDSIDSTFGAKPKSAVESTVLPNFFDYSFEPSITSNSHTEIPTYPRVDNFNRFFRRDFGFAEDDILLLQHTRIVERKNIERSIDFLCALKKARPERADKFKLVISCKCLDEGSVYFDSLVSYATERGLAIRDSVVTRLRGREDVVFIGDRIDAVRQKENKGKTKIYHYLDPYPFCDFVCYPSTYEGWGNSLGEAIQACKPVMINRYPVYDSDIRPYGFRLLEIEDKITPETVEEALKLLENEAYRKEIVEHNFKIAGKVIGYNTAQDIIEPLIKELGEDIRRYEKFRAS